MKNLLNQIYLTIDKEYYIESPHFLGLTSMIASNSVGGYITRRAVDIYWRNILTNAGLTGYSTHSSRRWVINELRNKGVGIMTIAEIMGMNINTVRHYCDNNPDACSRAIATLGV